MHDDVNRDLYTRDFFMTWAEGSRRSAEAIVPIVMDLFRPRSVIDVGCGTGAWLSVFKAQGAEQVLGIDGPHVDPGILTIPPEEFMAFDLRRPLRLARTFDLALSVEVAEHLPRESADAFVDTLVGLAPVVVFSAAIPLDGGVSHLNEQWPDYWVDRFRRRAFVGFDALRRKVWRNDAVEYWYAQNTVVFVHRDRVNEFPALAAEPTVILPLVHPRNFMEKAERAKLPVNPRDLEPRAVLKAVPHLAMKALRRRLQHHRRPGWAG